MSTTLESTNWVMFARHSRAHQAGVAPPARAMHNSVSFHERGRFDPTSATSERACLCFFVSENLCTTSGGLQSLMNVCQSTNCGAVDNFTSGITCEGGVRHAGRSMRDGHFRVACGYRAW